MRTALILWLTAATIWLRTSMAAADDVPRPPTVSAAGIWESHGFGRTRDEARANAMHRAIEALQAKLRDRSEDAARWQPSDEFVRGLLRDDGFEGESVAVPPIGWARRWVLRLCEPDGAALDRLAENERRRVRAEQRQSCTTYAIGAMAGALALVWGLSRWRQKVGGR